MQNSDWNVIQTEALQVEYRHEQSNVTIFKLHVRLKNTTLMNIFFTEYPRE